MNENINIYSFNDECYVYLGDYNKLQQENKKLNGAIQTYDILLKSNIEENKRLKDNWNKLKEFIVKEYYMHLPLEASTKSITILIDKMQELEQGSVKDSKKCDSLQQKIDKALNKIDNMFNKGDENSIIDDLLELDKILKGSDSNDLGRICKNNTW